MAEDENESETQCQSCHMVFPNKDRLLQHVQAVHFITIDIDDSATNNHSNNTGIEVPEIISEEPCTSENNTEATDSRISYSKTNSSECEFGSSVDSESASFGTEFQTTDIVPSEKSAKHFTDQESESRIDITVNDDDVDPSSHDDKNQDEHHREIPLRTIDTIDMIDAFSSSSQNSTKDDSLSKQISNRLANLTQHLQDHGVHNIQDSKRSAEKYARRMRKTLASTVVKTEMSVTNQRDVKVYMYNKDRSFEPICTEPYDVLKNRLEKYDNHLEEYEEKKPSKQQPHVKDFYKNKDANESCEAFSAKVLNKLQNIFFMDPYFEITQYNHFGGLTLQLKSPEMVKKARKWFEDKRSKVKLDYLKMTGNQLKTVFKAFVRDCKVPPNKVNSIRGLQGMARMYKVPLSTVKIWYRVEKFIDRVLKKYFLANPKPNDSEMKEISSKTKIPCHVVSEWFFEKSKDKKNSVIHWDPVMKQVYVTLKHTPETKGVDNQKQEMPFETQPEKLQGTECVNTEIEKEQPDIIETVVEKLVVKKEIIPTDETLSCFTEIASSKSSISNEFQDIQAKPRKHIQVHTLEETARNFLKKLYDRLPTPDTEELSHIAKKVKAPREKVEAWYLFKNLMEKKSVQTVIKAIAQNLTQLMDHYHSLQGMITTLDLRNIAHTCKLPIRNVLIWYMMESNRTDIDKGSTFNWFYKLFLDFNIDELNKSIDTDHDENTCDMCRLNPDKVKPGSNQTAGNDRVTKSYLDKQDSKSTIKIEDDSHSSGHDSDVILCDSNDTEIKTTQTFEVVYLGNKNQLTEVVNKNLESGESNFESGTNNLESGKNNLESGTNNLESGKNNLESGRNNLESGKSNLESGTNDLESGKSNLESGTNDLESGKSNLESGKSNLESGKSNLESGTNNLESGTNDLESGTNDLESGKSNLESGTNNLESGKINLERREYNLESGENYLESNTILSQSEEHHKIISENSSSVTDKVDISAECVNISEEISNKNSPWSEIRAEHSNDKPIQSENSGISENKDDDDDINDETEPLSLDEESDIITAENVGEKNNSEEKQSESIGRDLENEGIPVSSDVQISQDGIRGVTNPNDINLKRSEILFDQVFGNSAKQSEQKEKQPESIGGDLENEGIPVRSDIGISQECSRGDTNKNDTNLKQSEILFDQVFGNGARQMEQKDVRNTGFENSKTLKQSTENAEKSAFSAESDIEDADIVCDEGNYQITSLDLEKDVEENGTMANSEVTNEDDMIISQILKSIESDYGNDDATEEADFEESEEFRSFNVDEDSVQKTTLREVRFSTKRKEHNVCHVIDEESSNEMEAATSIRLENSAENNFMAKIGGNYGSENWSTGGLQVKQEKQPDMYTTDSLRNMLSIQTKQTKKVFKPRIPFENTKTKTLFDANDKVQLNFYFNVNPDPSLEELRNIASELNNDVLRVKIWFDQKKDLIQRLGKDNTASSFTKQQNYGCNRLEQLNPVYEKQASYKYSINFIEGLKEELSGVVNQESESKLTTWYLENKKCLTFPKMKAASVNFGIPIRVVKAWYYLQKKLDTIGTEVETFELIHNLKVKTEHETSKEMDRWTERKLARINSTVERHDMRNTASTVEKNTASFDKLMERHNMRSTASTVEKNDIQSFDSPMEIHNRDDMEKVDKAKRKRRHNDEDDIDWCKTGPRYNIRSDTDVVSYSDRSKRTKKGIVTYRESSPETGGSVIGDIDNKASCDDDDSSFFGLSSRNIEASQPVSWDEIIGKTNQKGTSGNNKVSTTFNKTSVMSDIHLLHSQNQSTVTSDVHEINSQFQSSVGSDRRNSKIISVSQNEKADSESQIDCPIRRNRNIPFRSNSNKNIPFNSNSNILKSMKDIDKSCQVVLQRCDEISAIEREKLELYYLKNPFPSDEEMQVIAEILGLYKKVIVDWFHMKNLGNPSRNSRRKSKDLYEEIEFEIIPDDDIEEKADTGSVSLRSRSKDKIANGPSIGDTVKTRKRTKTNHGRISRQSSRVSGQIDYDLDSLSTEAFSNRDNDSDAGNRIVEARKRSARVSVHSLENVGSRTKKKRDNASNSLQDNVENIDLDILDTFSVKPSIDLTEDDDKQTPTKDLISTGLYIASNQSMPANPVQTGCNQPISLPSNAQLVVSNNGVLQLVNAADQSNSGILQLVNASDQSNSGILQLVNAADNIGVLQLQKASDNSNNRILQVPNAPDQSNNALLQIVNASGQLSSNNIGFSPQEFQPAVIHPQDYHQVVNPQDYHPVLINPQDFQQTVINPQDYQPAVMNPQDYQPAVMNPQDYQPAVMNPQDYQPAVMNPQDYQPAVMNPQDYQPAVMNPQDYQPAVMNPQDYQPAVMNPQGYQPAVIKACGKEVKTINYHVKVGSEQDAEQSLEIVVNDDNTIETGQSKSRNNKEQNTEKPAITTPQTITTNLATAGSSREPSIATASHVSKKTACDVAEETVSPVHKMKKLIEMYELDPAPTVMEMNIIAKLLDLEPAFVHKWFKDMRTSGHSFAVPGVQPAPQHQQQPQQASIPTSESMSLQNTSILHSMMSQAALQTRLTPDSTTPF